jgi:hypothetical protein
MPIHLCEKDVNFFLRWHTHGFINRYARAINRAPTSTRGFINRYARAINRYARAINRYARAYKSRPYINTKLTFYNAYAILSMNG